MEACVKGAEADITFDGGRVVKRRGSKSYRAAALDVRLRRQRTRSEARNISRAREAGVRVPKLLSMDDKEYVLVFERIDGELLRDVFGRGESVRELSVEVGGILRRLHDGGIVHNDLTTSNLIASAGGVYLIDFGLAYHTARLEDKAMDLVVFKKSIKATHTSISAMIWAGLMEGYLPDRETLKRVETIENRVRYKGANHS